MKMEWVASPNFNDRIKFDKPTMIVMHYTGMKTAEEAIHRLADPTSKVSAHYVIAESGSLFHLVEENMRAWHAGKSYWRGCHDVNSASIGIEICNPGHEFGYVDFSPQQMETVIWLSKKIIAQYEIQPWNIVGHSDVAPLRKFDPGERFGWEDLAHQGIGFWPARTSPKNIKASSENLSELLEKIGYDPAAIQQKQQAVINAFCRRFLPEHFVNFASDVDVRMRAQLVADWIIKATTHS